MDKDKIYFIIEEGTNRRILNGDGTALMVDAEHIDTLVEVFKKNIPLKRSGRGWKRVKYQPISLAEYENTFGDIKACSCD